MSFLGAPDPSTGPAMPNPLGMVLVQGQPSNDPSAMKIPGPQFGISKNDLVWETPAPVGFVFQFPILLLNEGPNMPPNLAGPAVGCLTTRDPRAVRETVVGANDGVLAHGIPINFGAGRGSWVAGDARFFQVECESSGETVGFTNYFYSHFQPDVEWVTYVFKPGSDGVHGDFDFYFQNTQRPFSTGRGPFSLKQLPAPPDTFVPDTLGFTVGGIRIRIKYVKNPND